MTRRLLFLLPLATLALMAGLLRLGRWWQGAIRPRSARCWSGRPAPKLDVRALRDGDKPLTNALLATGKPVLVEFSRQAGARPAWPSIPCSCGWPSARAR